MKKFLYSIGAVGLLLLWGGPSEAAVNLALQSNGGVASQSSAGTAGNCNNGTTNGDANWCHTFSDPAPFWQVQLTGDFLIDNVVIWNRTDCCSDRLGNFTVAIFDDATQVWAENHVYTEFTSLDATHLMLDLDVAEGISGDRVRISINQPFINGNGPSFQWLNLAEVEVFQDETAASVPEPTTLAIVGLSLAGLGFVRRRRTDRAV